MTGTIITRVSRFQFLYRRTPHTTTGVPSAELLFGRISRSHLDLLKPDISNRVKDKQQVQRENHDVHAKERRFVVGDPVFIKEFPSSKHWLPGVISSVEGPPSYHDTLTDDRVVRRHVRKHSSEISQSDSEPVGKFLGYPSTYPAVGPGLPLSLTLEFLTTRVTPSSFF